MTIGQRLREERERIGLSQPKFAAIAGTTKQTLFSWESGKTAPDAFQIAALAGAGIDVMYVLTGQRAAVMQVAEQPGLYALNRREQALIENYRGSDEQGRKAVEVTATALANRDDATQDKRSGSQ